MSDALFNIPVWLDYQDYDNYPSQANPTTNANFISYATNQNKLVGALTKALLWQPNTNFIAGKVIISPNMPEGMEAVALTGGVTGNSEPAWKVDTAEYQDSGVKWQLRYQHWSKEVEQITDLTTGATNRLPNTSYEIDNVVYDRSNLSVALKCTTAGTTSNAELDISGKAVGERVEDGSVVWKVIARSNVLDEDGALSIRNGGTNATTVDKARENLQTNLKTFTNTSQLGLEINNCTILDVMNKMSNDTVFVQYVSPSIYGKFGVPAGGVVTIERINGNFILIHKQAGSGEKIWLGIKTDNGATWKKFSLNGALSMPSVSAISIDFSTTEYTAPCDGYLMVSASFDNENGYVRATSNSVLQLQLNVSAKTDFIQRGFLPLAKGNVVNIELNSASIVGLQFVYAQSEV